MPYLSEKLHLPRSLDRRVQITDTQRAEVKRLSDEGYSDRAIAKELCISRPMVGFIINPEKWKENLKKRAERKDSTRQYLKDKDKDKEWKIQSRRYKQKMHMEHNLVNNKKIEITHLVHFSITAHHDELMCKCAKSLFNGIYNKTALINSITKYQSQKLRRELPHSVTLKVSEDILERLIIINQGLKCH